MKLWEVLKLAEDIEGGYIAQCPSFILAKSDGKLHIMIRRTASLQEFINSNDWDAIEIKKPESDPG